MVYEFRVLSCYDCKFFQVDQVKKSSNKWACKLCGQKQSVKQVLFQGGSKDCRQYVQKLNSQQGVIEQERSNDCPDNFRSHNASQYAMVTSGTVCSKVSTNGNEKGTSKWEVFKEDPEVSGTCQADNEEEDLALNTWVPSWQSRKEVLKKSRFKGTKQRSYRLHDTKPYVRNDTGTKRSSQEPSQQDSQHCFTEKRTRCVKTCDPHGDDPDDDFCLPFTDSDNNHRPHKIAAPGNVEGTSLSSKWSEYLS